MANYCVYSGGSGASGAVAGSVPTAGEWATAYQSIGACTTAVVQNAGDIIFVAHDHIGSYGVTTTIGVDVVTGSTGVRILSIDRLNTTTATLKSGAFEGTSGNFGITLNGNFYVYGLTLQVGAGASSSAADLILGNNATTSAIEIFENCIFWINSTNSDANISIGNTDATASKYIEFNNCSFRWLPGSGRALNFTGGGEFVFNQCTVHPLSAIPIALFTIFTNRTNPHIVSNACDWGMAQRLSNSFNPDPTWVDFYNCKIPADILLSPIVPIGGAVVTLQGCTVDNSIIEYYRNDGFGVYTTSKTVYPAVGSSYAKQADGTRPAYTILCTPTTYASRYIPVPSPWVTAFVGSTGSKTFSMKCAYDSATVSQNTDLWLEVEYYGNASSAKATSEVSAPTAEAGISRDPIVAGSNLTDTAEVWAGTQNWVNKKTHTLSKTVTVNQIGYVRCRLVTARTVPLYFNNVVSVT